MKEYIVENLRKLVRIQSVSDNNMDEIIAFTREILLGIGVEVREVYGDSHAPVILASYGSGGVCFSGHLDVVPLGDGWSREQGEVVGNRMYGRGTLDMKGPCMAMIATAKELVERRIPFSLVFTTDEEVSMNGALAVAHEPEIVDAPAVVICEPTGMLVVTREKGVFQFRVRTKGVNAHASMPEKGENAIIKMLPLLEKLNSKNNIPAGTDDISCCVDVIRGGSATNVIPNECTAEVDVRFPHTFDRESIREHLFRSVDVPFEFELIQYLDPVKVDDDAECVCKMLEIAKTDLWAVPYGTEMVRFAETNPNTFIFGPGQVDVAHKPDEWIDLDELVKAVDMYCEYAEIMYR